MTLRISTSTKLMGAGILLSLGWFVLESCDCDETKEEKFPGFWVTCIANKPTLMTYNGDRASIVTSDQAGNFDPKDYDCKHPNSPPAPKTASPAFPSGPPGGPESKAHAATPQRAYLPQTVRQLPFVPHFPNTATPACDASYPDIFQTVHTQALVTRISTCPFKIVATIPVITRPLQVQVTPDGTTALVTSFDNAVNFIDVASNKVTFTLKTDQSINPQGLEISADGTRAYITSFNTNNPLIAVIDLATRKIIATIPTNVYPQGAFLTPDGSQLWITYPLGASVDVFDTLTNTRIGGLAIRLTTDIAFNSTGTKAYITSQATVPGKVVQVDTSSLQITKSYTVGSGPTDIAMSYGDEFLVVNNNGDGSISVIDLVRDAIVTTKVGNNPSGIAFVH